MRNPLTDVVVLLCQAALMEEEMAATFLQERLETRQTVNDWLLLALMWLRPEEAHEKYLALTQGQYAVTFVSSKIEALWQAHRLRASDEEAQEAYHVMGALLSSDPVEASKYQSMQSYLCALDSLEAYLTLPYWGGLPDIPLLVHLAQELPEKVEGEITTRNVPGWGKLFYTIRLLLILHPEGPKEGAEMVRLIQNQRRIGGELYHDVEVYAVVQAVDFLADKEPQHLPNLLPDLQPYSHTRPGDSRVRLRAYILAILAPGVVGFSELKELITRGLLDTSKAIFLERWDRRMGSVIYKITLTDERLPEFACRELMRLRRVLSREQL